MGRHDDRPSCRKEERHDIFKGMTSYPLSLLSKREKVYIFPSMPNGGIVESHGDFT